MNSPNQDKLNLLKPNPISTDYNMTRRNFTDKISIKGCHYILSLDFETFSEICGGEVCLGDKIYNPLQYYNTLRRNCKKWISLSDDDNAFVEIKQKYKFAKGQKSGRIYVDGFGIQSLQHQIRKILTGDYYADIDVKNCHPNLLLSMIEEYNKEYDDEISCTHLKKYCKVRDKILEKYKLTKIQLLKALNKDDIGLEENAFIKKFHREKQDAYEAFLENEEYMKKYGEIITKNDTNPISSKINKVFCINENKIIQYAMKEEHTHLVPMFDGFMIDKSYKDTYTYELIDCCPDGCNIQWAYKSNICENEDFINFEYSNADKLQYSMMENITNKVDKDYSLDGEVADVVIHWLYSICGEDIVYHDNLIFNYNNGIYKKSIAEKGNYELKQTLDKYITPHIYKTYKTEKDILQTIDQKKDKTKYDSQKSKIDKWKILYSLITSCRTIQNVLGNYISTSKYKQVDFYDSLDANPALIAFDNKVYDLYEGKFRSVKKEDRISTTTGYIWDEPSESLMKEFQEQFINKIFIDEKIRKHFLLSLCSCLDGTKRRHKFTIWSNSGRNGKSIMMMMLKKMLGKYFGVMNSTVLQNVKSDSGAANPQYAVLKNCRIVSINEPEASRKLNSNLIKEISGGDEITMRRLYASDVETFKPKASICMACNDIPNMDKNDSAIMNRLDLIPFQSTFGIRPDGSAIEKTNIKEKEFIADNDIENKLVKWRCCFFKMIVAHFKEYMIKPNFTITTELGTEYKVAQDIVQEFIEEKLEKVANNKILIKDFCHHLNKYIKDKDGSKIHFNSRTISKYLRINKYDIIKQSGDCYVSGYNFNWMTNNYNNNGCMITEDEIDDLG